MLFRSQGSGAKEKIRPAFEKVGIIGFGWHTFDYPRLLVVQQPNLQAAAQTKIEENAGIKGFELI